jgi:hypothetical protein
MVSYDHLTVEQSVSCVALLRMVFLETVFLKLILVVEGAMVFMWLLVGSHTWIKSVMLDIEGDICYVWYSTSLHESLCI